MSDSYTYTTASRHTVLQWLLAGLFTVDDEGRIYRGTRELAQRVNKRRNSDRGDPRVDLFMRGQRKSIHVSHLVWMANTKKEIPEGWEIHHLDGDPMNNAFSNLLCLHPLDHLKLHVPEEEDDIPF